MDYFLTIAILILIFIILNQSYNLVLGYTGMIHVGHVAFMAIGAYSAALLAISGVNFWIGLISGVGLSALAGFLLGLPTVRFRDDYLVAATLGMGEIIRLILLNERQFTGGSTGIPKILRPEIFGISLQNNFYYLIFTLVITLIVLAFIWRLVRCPFGKVLESIREDETAAKSLGKNTTLVKLQILIIGAAIAGLSGVLYAHSVQFIDPDSFNIERMLFVFLQVVFGGSGTFFGPIVGTIILFTLFESIRFLPIPSHIMGPARWILYSLILIIVIIFKPTGILGKKLIRRKL
ncbi:branched-chain amino acid ABC transporter permease [Candidatus Peregrinibacteria bacterium]|nr:branched-chain amino acid ABC transporter permease [Candidatus Peregrinibacteria bacterium]